MKQQTFFLAAACLFLTLPVQAEPTATCEGKDLAQRYSLVCEVFFQGIDNDSSSYSKRLEITQSSCEDAKPSVDGNTGLKLEFSGEEFRGGLQILNDHAALNLQPKKYKPTYMRMSPEALDKPLTLTVSLDESFTDTDENLIQDLSITCRKKQ